MQQLSGNLKGLSPGQKKMLERIWRRRIDPAYIISPELASFLCECSREIGRQVGVLIDRRGDVGEVVVGDLGRLELPDLGPRRAGAGRLRGVRLVHTHLRAEPLTRDDLLDLAKLRLDLVAAILMTPQGQVGPLVAAHLLPLNPDGEQWRMLEPISAPELLRGHRLDFLELIRSLEEELAAKAPATRKVAGGDGAVLVQLLAGRDGDGQRARAERRLEELRELCRTADVQVLDVIVQRRAQLDPRYLIGKGKLDELVLRALQADANLIVFDRDLTPVQARNISDATELKVIDRTMLILDIFAQHALSRDGRLQVELAQLKYTLPRLHEKNTMMSRLTGGIGGRGPGETKLELNRRRAREKIHRYEQEIKQLSRRREQRRGRRVSSQLPIVSIVGYTNAGKSTLLNTLTRSQVLVENKLFATLDPTSRRLRFPDEREIIVTDTVGFIRDLPADLISAFRATLEELDEADLLLHLVDAADPARGDQIAAVEQILEQLELLRKPRLMVFNKMDRLGADGRSELASEYPHALTISAIDGETTGPLLRAMEQVLWEQDRLAERPIAGG